jgi:uncharacterized membrane protein YjjP (DUF1212 family)
VIDTEHLPTALACILLALIGASYAVSLGGHLRDVVLVASLATIIGTLVAYRAQRRGFRLEPFTIIARYQGAGLVLGTVVELLEAAL